MKIKDGFVLRKVADQYVVIATGEASKDFYGMVKLNESGADIWQGLIDGCDEAGVVRRLMDKYDLEEEKAKESVKKFMEQMESAGFLTE